jgi:hypothetical protein
MDGGQPLRQIRIGCLDRVQVFHKNCGLARNDPLSLPGMMAARMCDVDLTLRAKLCWLAQGADYSCYFIVTQMDCGVAGWR